MDVCFLGSALPPNAYIVCIVLCCINKHSYSILHMHETSPNPCYAALVWTLTSYVAGVGRCFASAAMIKLPRPVVSLWYFDHIIYKRLRNGSQTLWTQELKFIHSSRGLKQEQGWGKNCYSLMVVNAIIDTKRLWHILQFMLTLLYLFFCSGSSISVINRYFFSLIALLFSIASDLALFCSFCLKLGIHNPTYTLVTDYKKRLGVQLSNWPQQGFFYDD